MVKTYHNQFRLQWRSSSREPTLLLLTYSLFAKERQAFLDFFVMPEAQLRIIILVHLHKQSRLDLHTVQNHLGAESFSNLICKTVINQQSQFSYQGKVIIPKRVKEVHAYQRNDNLILDSDSMVVSEPNLEILANEVFCTHGSTTGFLDPLALFYLQTRGLPNSQSVILLTKSFLLSALTSSENQACFDASKLNDLEKQTLNRLAISGKANG